MILSNYAIWFTIGGAVIGLTAAVLLGRGSSWPIARGRRRCPKCWYDRSGVESLTCPECGHESKSARALHRTRRHWWRAAFAVGIGLIAFGVWRTPVVAAKGLWSLVPSRVVDWYCQHHPDEAELLYQTVYTPSPAAGWFMPGDDS